MFHAETSKIKVYGLLATPSLIHSDIKFKSDSMDSSIHIIIRIISHNIQYYYYRRLDNIWQMHMVVTTFVVKPYSGGAAPIIIH